jgi:Protein of unknown function (DUF3891)
MFKSKQRPVVIPQWEHQKLAGTLALLWGNTDFERPSVPFESFLVGVGLHDRAYGPVDNLPIGGLPEEQWLTLTRHGVTPTSPASRRRSGHSGPVVAGIASSARCRAWWRR